jgi:hypothetical protein
MARQEWRCKVIPSCLGQAQEAVAQLRSRGVLADLHRETWLVLGLWVEEGADLDAMAAQTLDRTWPAWRECVTE